MSGAAARTKVRASIDWGALAPLRLRSRAVAEGLYAGSHRSVRRGAGVEFGGHREYVPGDDLRWLDRRSLLRHDRLMVRQFETETDRALCLLVDASASMGFRGERAPGAKLAYASVIAASLARVALGTGDPVSLSFLGGASGTQPVPSVRRAVASSSNASWRPSRRSSRAATCASTSSRSIAALAVAGASAARRGAVVTFVLSDLVDLPPRPRPTGSPPSPRAGASSSSCRPSTPTSSICPIPAPCACAPSRGTRSSRPTPKRRGPRTSRSSIEALKAEWRAAIVERGGRMVSATTADDPIVREVVKAVR